MRIGESPYLADWFAISFRWLAIVGLTMTLSISGTLSLATGAVLVISSLWNFFMSYLAIFNRRVSGHRLINTLLDLVTAGLLFIFSGGLTGPITWVGLIALLSASIYFEWRGALLGSLALLGAQAGWVFLTGGDLYSAGAIRVAVLDLVLALVLGVLSVFLMKSLRAKYRAVLRQKHENDQRVQMQERNRMQTFLQMAETLSASLDYQVVLDASLDLTLNALSSYAPNSGQMVCAVLLFDEHDLRIGTARRLPQADMNRTFPAERGALNAVIKTGEPQCLRQPMTDPELNVLLGLQICKSALLLPLMRGLNAYGVLLFAHPEEDFFTDERINVMEMIGQQAVIAIQNARLYQDVQQEKERIVETQDEARKKLARDLHDGPTQSVAAIAMRINIARKMLQSAPREVEPELARVEDLARRTTQEIRHMLFTMRPLVLETEGLIAALNAMAGKMKDTYQQNVQIDADPEVVKKLEIAKQTVVFYLAEEAVNNARKHAQASLIAVRLKHIPQDCSFALLEIVDNGVGFNVDEVNRSYESRGSLGMVNLRERTDLVNGQLRILSAPGKGTRVQIIIPLTDEALDRLQRNLAKSTPTSGN